MDEKEIQAHKEKVNSLKGVQAGSDPAAEKDQEEIEGIVTLTLSKEIDGNKEVILDFTTITGFFLENCRKQYKRIREVKKETLNIESMDDKYYVVIASKLLDIPYKKIMELPYKDYKAILDEVRSFLNED